MKTLKGHKYPRVLSKIFVILGMLLLVVGVFGFVKTGLEDMDRLLSSSKLNSIIHCIQGVLFIGLGWYNLKTPKFYIKWNDEELRFVLPPEERLNIIKFSEIESVQILLFKVVIQHQSKTETLDLSMLSDDDLKTVKQRFNDFQASSSH